MPIFLPGPIFGFGYGGDSYGYSPYGAPAFPRPPTPTTGGFGGAPFGHSSYGSVDITPPRVTSVQSLDGFRVEVFFSEEMDVATTLAATYVFTASLGVAVSSVSVAEGTMGSHGLTSAIVTHTGTTLGGSYVLTVTGATDVAGNPIGPPPVNSGGFLAFGDVPQVTAALPTVDDGRTVELTFKRSDTTATQEMLPEAEYTPGIDDPSSYAVTTAYPVVPTVSSAQLQASPDDYQVLVDVHPMTSTTYDMKVGPALAFDYSGTILPSSDTTLDAVEFGTGTSSASPSGLLLSKAAGVSYGWVLGDKSSRLVPGTTFQADVRFDASASTIAPPIVGAPTARFAVCDGGVQINILLNDVAGTKVIDVLSPGLIGQVPAAWDSGQHTVSLVRNIKGGFYSLLLDGTPLLSFPAGAALGAPSFPVGAPTGISVSLSPSASAVSLFKVVDAGLTASDTVFTTAWNFVHEKTATFTGSAVLTRDNLFTDRGPLVRGWGDATPAQKDDVSVKLNGTAVTVKKVNPYHGQIFPEIPIPLTSKPSAATGTIEVGPAQPSAGVAIITVNGVSIQEDAAIGWANGADIYATAAAIGAAITTHCGVSVDVMGSLLEIEALVVGAAGNLIGLANTSADPNIAVSGATLSGGINEMEVTTDYIWFANPPMEFSGLNTMGLTLNKWDRAQGHTAPPVSSTMTGAGTPEMGRFPMGLLLAPMTRQSPVQIGHRYHGIQRDYSALLNAPTSLLLNINPHSVSLGGVSSAALRESGTFNGNNNPTEQASRWVESGVVSGVVSPTGWELTDATSGSYGIGYEALYSREADLSFPSECLYYARLKVDSYTADGVFTGVGFGVHDNNHLVLAGFVVVDGIRHMGFLKDPDNIHLEEGWMMGPSVSATGITTTTISIPYANLPFGLNQASGSEVAWTKFRIPEGPQKGVYQIAACGMELDAEGNVEITLMSPLAVDPSKFGADVFDVLFDVPWDQDFATYQLHASFPASSAKLYIGGSLSGLALSITEAIPYPAETSLVLPEGDEGVFFWGSPSRQARSVSTWALASYSSTPETIMHTVKGVDVFTEMGRVPQDETQDPWFVTGGFGYAEVDATGSRLLLASTSGDSSGTPNLEYGYTRIEPYLTPEVTADLEGTFHLETASLGGGAAQLSIRDTVREAKIATLSIRQFPATTNPNYLNQLPFVSVSGLQDPTAEGWGTPSSNNLGTMIRGDRIFVSKTPTTSGFWDAKIVSGAWEGLITQMRVGVSSYTLGSTPYIGVFVSGNPSNRPVSTILGVQAGAPSVMLVDNAAATVASFPFDFTDGAIHTYRTIIDPVADIVVLKIDDVVVGNVAYSAFSPASTATTQFGVMGDSAVESVWESVTVTPLRPTGTNTRTFGIWTGGDQQDINNYKIPRTDGFPDLPNSDYRAAFVEMDWRSDCRIRAYLDPAWGVGLYRPDLPLPPWATGNFATETTDPSAAWANVEYSLLPLQTEERGLLSFGAVNPMGVSQQRWDSVRYRIRAVPTGYGATPQGMVLNRATPLTSGELIYDTTPEVVTVRSLTNRTVSVWSSNMIADRVFVVSVDGSVLPSAVWAFDPDTQIITLMNALPEARYPVTITFAAGKPVTDTYLCSQPLSGSVTVLNEGTPPMPLSRDSGATRSVVAGSIINDPHDVLDDAATLITNDPKRTVEFELGPDALYADLDTCEVEDGESINISTLCDAPGPGMGFSHLEIEGPFVNNQFTVPGGPAGPHTGSPSIKGSTTHFNPAVIFMASGGGIKGGNLGPGTAILHPNQRGPSQSPPPGGFGINQDFGIALVDVTPREDAYAFPVGADNTTPSGVSPANGLGAADAVLEDYSAVASHLGPSGGLPGLIASNSLLAGGTPLNGGELTLVGGSPLPKPATTTFVIQHP